MKKTATKTFQVLRAITLFITLFLVQPTQAQSDELISLSIKELMNIPLNVNYSRERIFQSDTNKISSDTVNFGILAPISSFPIYSAEIVAAADLATQYINQNGGIGGKRLVVIRADDEENTSVSAKLADTLINQYKVQAIVGPATSDSVADVIQKVTGPAKIPLISQAASSVKLSYINHGQLFWRMVANNYQQVELIVEHLHRKLGHKRLYIISGRDIYSQEISQGIKAYMAKQPGGWVDELNISSLVYLDGMNLEDEIAQIQQSGATAIVITLPTAQMTATLRKIGHHWKGEYPLLLAADTVKPKYIREAGLGDITNCILTYVSSPTELAPELREKITTMLNRDSAGFDAAYVYDAIVLLSMAKQLELTLGIDLKTAISKIAADGHPISHKDYPNIVALYKRYGSLSYSSYSGRVWFNRLGDNIKANMKIYPLTTTSTANHSCLQKQK